MRDGAPKVLIACEFSGIVRDAFLARGHDAMSCDLLQTESPGPHYQGDVRDDEPVLVPGFPAYRIYRDGNLETRWRSGMFYSGFEVEDQWRTPKLSRHERGYLNVSLRDGHGGKRRTHIHVLVAEVFIGPKPFPKAVVRHLDNDPTNNHVSNLAWGTYKDNEDDKIAHGTWNTRNGGARLTPEQVQDVRLRCEAGHRHQDIANDFGVSRPTVTRIANHTTWRQP